MNAGRDREGSRGRGVAGRAGGCVWREEGRGAHLGVRGGGGVEDALVHRAGLELREGTSGGFRECQRRSIDPRGAPARGGVSRGRGARRAIARRGFESRRTIARRTRTRAPRAARAPRVGSRAPSRAASRGFRASPARPGRARLGTSGVGRSGRTVTSTWYPTRTSVTNARRSRAGARPAATIARVRGGSSGGRIGRQAPPGNLNRGAGDSLEERGSPTAASRRTVEIDRVRCRAFDEAPSLRVAPRRARRMCRARSSTRAIKNPRAPGTNSLLSSSTTAAIATRAAHFTCCQGSSDSATKRATKLTRSRSKNSNM